MKCIDVKKKYKTSLTTIIMTTISLIVLYILIFFTNVSDKVDKNNVILLTLLITGLTIGGYTSLYDPTQLCGTIQTNCRLKILLITIFQEMIQVPLRYFLIKQLLGTVNIWCYIIPLFVAVINILVVYIKYITPEQEIIDDPVNVLKCQFIRIVFYSVLLGFELFWALTYFKKITPADQFAEAYGLPKEWGKIILPLYVIFTIIMPILIALFGLDGAIKYDITEIKVS